MFPVFFEGVAIDVDVVYEASAEVVDKVKLGIIDEILKGCWCVTEAQRHDFVLIMTKACTEGCFPLISFGYPDEVVSECQVKFVVLLSFGKVVQSFTN